MDLIQVKTRNKKRIGRGLSAGQGKTSGRGTKGQKSRSGYNLPNRYAGGESPLSLRLPKLPGFKSHKKKAVVISFDDISNNFKNGEIISIATLLEKDLIRKGEKAKILSNGKLTVTVKIDDNVRVSESAKKLLESPVSKKETVESKEKEVEPKKEKKVVAEKTTVKKTTPKEPSKSEE